MKLHGTWNLNPPGMKAKYFRSVPQMLVLLLCLGVRLPSGAQEPATATLPKVEPLRTEEVVQNLIRMNAERSQALRAYRATRVYRVEYRGLAGTRSAEMVVKVKYESPRTKEFVIQSATGSKLVIDKVLKKLLEAEKEALDVEIQRRSDLTDANYRFTLVGYKSELSGATYVLRVEPRTKDKFLYRGRIWVDAEDFALVRLEAEPAKNPSFWTRKAEVLQVYMKVGDFWLPAYNHSSTAIRLGGHAELTIEYKDYEITGASRVSSLSMLRSTPRAENTRGQK